MRRAVFCFIALYLAFCSSLQAQDQSERVFQNIGEYLRGDVRARPYTNPLLFVGEVSALGPVYQEVCKEAVNQIVDFSVSELLLGDLSEDSFQYGYPNCTRQPLPSPPFTLHSQIILYCHHQHNCFEPVPLTTERLQTLRAWVVEARREEDQAVWTQFMQAIRKARPLKASRDLIFEGEVDRIQPKGPPVCTVAVPRKVEISVVDVLFGEPTKGPVLANYGSVNCPSALPLSVRLRAKVIAYCKQQPSLVLYCYPPVESSPRKLAKVKSWIAAENPPVKH